MLAPSDKQEKILETSGPLLITGGPGSGKTTISILKAKLIIGNDLKPAQKILFLSFSRAAVSRVIEAINENSALSSEERRRLDIETYHSFFWRIIKTHGYLVGLPKKLSVMASAEEAVCLSEIRNAFPPDGKQSPEVIDAKHFAENRIIHDEKRRLGLKEGKISFDLFSEFVIEIITQSSKIRNLICNAYPCLILDEFQDTNGPQWEIIKCLGKGTRLIALADPDQRIYDFIGADPARLSHFESEFKPTLFDLEGNHRSPGTEIALFGNDILTEKFKPLPYTGVTIQKYAHNSEEQAFYSLKLQVVTARRRILDAKIPNWSLAILVPNKKLMRKVSALLRSTDHFGEINHTAFIDMEGAILAAEIIAFLLQPVSGPHDEMEFIQLLSNFYRGKGGGKPAKTHLSTAGRILKNYDDSLQKLESGKPLQKRNLYHTIHPVYEKARKHVLTGDPGLDWLGIRQIIEEGECEQLKEVGQEARNIRLLDRGTILRDSLALSWRENRCYKSALRIVREAFVQEHFASVGKVERGVIVMNMHKSKGKQFDEVIIFEGWPIIANRRIVSNSNRIVWEGNTRHAKLSSDKQNLRVSITRAKKQVLIMTPEANPCILLPRS